jgi:hypothetical protein
MSKTDSRVSRGARALDPFNSAAHSFIGGTKALFLQQAGDPIAAQELAWQKARASEGNEIKTNVLRR